MSYFGSWNGSYAGSWWGRVAAALQNIFVIFARRQGRR